LANRTSNNKIQNWREEWERLVGDHKYLAIKNWDEFQANDLTVNWIKDYVDKDFEQDHAKLTMYQSALLDRVRRFRGRLRKNIPADVETVLCACCVPAEERRYGGYALVVLVLCGFLIPTNEQLNLQEKRRVEKSRKELKQAPTEQAAAAKIPLEQTGQNKPKTPPQAETLEQQIARVNAKYENAGVSPAKPAPSKVAPPKSEKFLPLAYRKAIGTYPAEEVRRVIFYHWKAAKDDYWRTVGEGKGNITSEARLLKMFDRMAEQVPENFRLPGSETMSVMLPQPNCKKCDGTGETLVDHPAYPAGMYKIAELCDCRREAN
jgi:hypothetical protein